MVGCMYAEDFLKISSFGSIKSFTITRSKEFRIILKKIFEWGFVCSALNNISPSDIFSTFL